MNDKQAASGWAEPAPTAVLVLADGTVLEGHGLGATGHAVEYAGEAVRSLIALGLLHLIAAAARTFRICAALVSLVDDDEVPSLLPYTFTHVVLLRIVVRADHLRLALQQVQKLLLIVAGMDDLKGLTKKSGAARPATES